MEVLLFTVGKQCCALPLGDVAEVMRAQPLSSHGMLTAGVLGTAIIRGQATPVVDAGQLLCGERAQGGRLVLLRVGSRRVALAVDSVLGTTPSTERQLDAAPALLTGNKPVIERIGVLDSELVHVLSAVRVMAECDASHEDPKQRDAPTAADR